MTVQPELDLANGLVLGLPFENERRSKELEVNAANCLPTNSKVEDVPRNVYLSHSGSGSNVSKTNRVAFVVSLDDGTPFNVLASLASRRTYFVDGDERYETKRKALVNAARIAVANGVAKLPEGYTLDDLNNLKGFRWSPKAGCSMCPCSPAFMSPLVAVDNNWVEAVFRVKQDETVATMLDMGVVEQLASDPTLNPVA